MQNAVLIYMSCARDMPILFRSVLLLFENWKYAKDYPIIIFHDDINKVMQSNLYTSLHQYLGYIPNIKFEILNFQFPSNFDNNPIKFDKDVPLSEFWMGYRHMCRFHSGEIYKEPRLLKYDWYWRLDSDSYFLSKIDFDPFDHMAANNLEYAYIAEEDKDVPRVVKGLGEFTLDYARKNNIDIKNLNSRLIKGKWDYNLYYTNFEIANFKVFRNTNYMNYYDALDKSGNIYYQRWGDAPIHWLGVQMFLEQNKIWCVKNIAYQHNNWIKNLSACPNLTPSEKTISIIEGNETSGRKGRLLYAINKCKQTGKDGVDWHD